MTKTAIRFNGRGDTFIEVQLLHKVRKNGYERDLIRWEIKSKTDHIACAMTEEEAVISATGLNHAVMLKMMREGRI